ncbi:phage tail protein [Streptomyces sp. NPDC056352]|uniref:phage tail protein n=1 Tax=Streptomyces sp. NPDC056352 TaxID=3345791 RepID=UPI0035DB5168
MSFLIASGHVEVEAKTDKALSAITAIVGAMGALGPTAAVAAAGVASAGAGLAAFGAAAGKQVVALAKASQAQGKYQEAVDKSGKRSAEAVKAELAYQQTLSKMPKATREATAAFSALSDSYQTWSDGLAGDTMPVFTKSFQLFSALLPKTTGLVKGTSAELDRMMNLIAGGVASPGFDRFMDKLTDLSAHSLRFMIDGVVDLSRSVANFAEGGGFNGFVDTAKEAGPLIGETLANLAKALLNITAAGGETGITLLTAANALAKLVNAIPPAALSAFLQLYAAMKLVSLGAAAVATVTGSAAVARLGAYFAVMRAAGVGTTLRATAASMTTMQKAAVGLGILGVAAIGISKLAEKARGAPPDVDRLTTSLKNLARTGQFTGELQKTFGDVEGLVKKIGELGSAAKSSEDYVKSFGNSGIGPLDDLRRKANGLWQDFTKGETSLKALKEDFGGLDSAMASMVSSGYGKQAAVDFDAISKAAHKAGYSTKEINDLFPEYRAAVAGLKADQALAAQGMGLFGSQAMATKAKLDEQKRSADGLRGAIQALNDIQRQGLGGMIGFEAAIDAATKAAKDNAGSLHMTNGVLNLNGEKARNAATALQDLAQKTDDAAGAARESGASWDTVNGIYARGTEQLVQSAMTMGLNETQARQLAAQILKIPDKKSTQIEMNREDAVAGLDSVIAKIKATPGSKSVTVKALTSDAITLLETLGYKTKTLPDGRVTVTAKTGSALAGIGAVQRARDALSNKNITITTTYVKRTVYDKDANSIPDMVQAPGRARGGLLNGYASGGHVQAFPGGGMIHGPGSSTSDSILGMFANGPARVSDSEYVVRAAAVRKYGVGVLNALNAGRLRLPGFAKGGKLSEKQKEAIRKQNEARGQLRGDVTLGNMSLLAGRKNPEIRGNLAKAGSESELITNLYALQSKIKGSFTGKTESKLLGQLNKSASSLFKLRDSSEKNSKALDAAKDKLNGLKDSFNQLRDSVKSSLIGFANITKIGKYGTSADTLIKQLSSDVGRTTEFSKQLEQLKARGLNAQSISEIAAAGVTGGGMATAQSLLGATPEQIAQINALEKQLAASADSAGKTTADAMYGAGIKAADGLVKGLTAQQAKIEAAMINIAKSMEAAIKKALGIKSPARRMEPVGDYAMQGVEVGWTKRLAKGKTLISGGPANAVKPSFVPPAESGATGTGGMTIQTLTVNVNGSFDLASPAQRRAAAKALVKDINDELRNYQRQRSVSR